MVSGWRGEPCRASRVDTWCTSSSVHDQRFPWICSSPVPGGVDSVAKIAAADDDHELSMQQAICASFGGSPVNHRTGFLPEILRSVHDALDSCCEDQDP
jgi:hypothetical protein